MVPDETRRASKTIAAMIRRWAWLAIALNIFASVLYVVFTDHRDNSANLANAGLWLGLMALFLSLIAFIESTNRERAWLAFGMIVILVASSCMIPRISS